MEGNTMPDCYSTFRMGKGYQNNDRVRAAGAYFWRVEMEMRMEKETSSAQLYKSGMKSGGANKVGWTGGALVGRADGQKPTGFGGEKSLEADEKLRCKGNRSLSGYGQHG